MMNSKQLCCLLCLLMLFVFASCDEDEYEYPPVKLEFLTAHTDADGHVSTILTDEGSTYQVVQNKANTQVNPNKDLRILANYSLAADANGVEVATLYALINAVSPMPTTADKFADGVKTDPVNVQSIWMGLNYLNVMLEIKAQDGKHLFHFIEDEVQTDALGHKTVRMTLFHDAGKDVQAYTKRAYLSVPLKQYATAGVTKVTVKFSVHLYSGDVKPYLFEYTPN